MPDIEWTPEAREKLSQAIQRVYSVADIPMLTDAVIRAVAPQLAEAEKRGKIAGLQRSMEIAKNVGGGAAAWIAHADSYGGPESPERVCQVARLNTADHIAAAILAEISTTAPCAKVPASNLRCQERADDSFE